MVAGRQRTMFFCLTHQKSALATALSTAHHEGKCGLSVPAMGDFQIISETPAGDTHHQPPPPSTRTPPAPPGG